MQSTVLKGQYNLLGHHHCNIMVEWKFVFRINGTQFVVTSGPSKMQLLFAEKWDTLSMVLILFGA